jgi:hypothetical protein
VIAAIVIAVTAAVAAAVLTLAPRSGGEPQRSPDVTEPAYPDVRAGAKPAAAAVAWAVICSTAYSRSRSWTKA